MLLENRNRVSYNDRKNVSKHVILILRTEILRRNKGGNMNPKIYDTAVIGAGAAGLMAAITAARAGAHVVLLEHMQQAAKKLLSTGNGKCNYTNADQKPEYYYCEDPFFIQTVFAQFSYADTIRFFEELGIRPVQKNGTCIYPESEQAASVRDVLLEEVMRLQIRVVDSVGIRMIHKIQDSKVFEIITKEQTYYSLACILAAGGKAAKKTGSDGSGYIYAEQLGHKLTDTVPALTALTADYKKWKLPAGVRIGCAATLLIDGQAAGCEQGELQITDYGISGIVIFQLSRTAAYALAAQKQAEVCLDLKPQMPQGELASYLQERFHGRYQAHKTAGHCLIGFLPKKLIAPVLRRAGIDADAGSRDISRQQAERLAGLLKSYKIKITGTKGFDAAQVTAGGIPVHEINAETMESKLVPRLYFAGEIVDVDAKCGGYNLQWAWSSGYAAGLHSCAASQE